MSARHPCPGPCGRQIQPHLFACSSCWNRLPPAVRDEINSRMRAARWTTAQQITTWFKERRR